MIPEEILSGVTVIDSSTHTTQFETSSAIKALTPNGLGADFALECIGKENVTIEAHACLDTLGTLITIGSSATAKLGVLISTHLVRGITIRGTHQGDSVSRFMVPKMIEMWRNGSFPFDKMVKRYGFEELGRAIEEVEAGRVVKPLLVV